MTGPGLDRRWGYLLKRVQADFRARMDSALALADLTASQYAALANLEDQPGLSNAELARRSFVTPQTMIRIVAGLEQRGLVTRRPRPGNGRVLDTELTGAGRSAVAHGHRIVRSIEAEMTSRLTESEHADLVDLLAKLLAG